MMKRSILLPAALLFGGAAITPAPAQQAAAPAQTPAQATTPAPGTSAPSTAPAPSAAPAAPATSSATPAPFTDAELVGFANAAIEADKIQKDVAVPATEKQAKMLAAVQAQGLEPTRYNEIAQATRTDPTLVTKIQELAAASAAAKAPATATP